MHYSSTFVNALVVDLDALSMSLGAVEDRMSVLINISMVRYILATTKLTLIPAVKPSCTLLIVKAAINAAPTPLPSSAGKI